MHSTRDHSSSRSAIENSFCGHLSGVMLSMLLPEWLYLESVVRLESTTKLVKKALMETVYSKPNNVFTILMKRSFLTCASKSWFDEIWTWHDFEHKSKIIEKGISVTNMQIANVGKDGKENRWDPTIIDRPILCSQRNGAAALSRTSIPTAMQTSPADGSPAHPACPCPAYSTSLSAVERRARPLGWPAGRPAVTENNMRNHTGTF